MFWWQKIVVVLRKQYDTNKNVFWKIFGKATFDCCFCVFLL